MKKKLKKYIKQLKKEKKFADERYVETNNDRFYLGLHAGITETIFELKALLKSLD